MNVFVISSWKIGVCVRERSLRSFNVADIVAAAATTLVRQ